MSWIKELLDEKGALSMTRFLSAICVLTAVAIAIYGMYKAVALDGLIGLTSTFLGFGLGAKVTQKWAEGKETKIEKE